MLCSRISVGHSMGKTTDLSSFDINIFCAFSSCVMDLYQFLFTSIDIEIRNRFMADFVCSVYYDSFVKTLMSINNTLAVFSKSDFIREFNDKIFCGFVFAAELHTWLVREAEWSCPDRHSRSELSGQKKLINANPIMSTDNCHISPYLHFHLFF